MTNRSPPLTLNKGVHMPALGLGVFQSARTPRQSTHSTQEFAADLSLTPSLSRTTAGRSLRRDDSESSQASCSVAS